MTISLIPSGIRRALYVSFGLFLPAAAAIAPSADAGTYSVPYCRDANGGVLANGQPLYDWTPGANTAAGGYIYEKCGVGGEPLTIDWTNQSARYGFQRSEWVLRPAAGLSIVRWEAHASATVNSPNTLVSLVAANPGTPDADSPTQSQYYKQCGSVDPVAGGGDCTNLVMAQTYQNAPTALTFSLDCFPGDCPGTATGRLGENIVTFRDSSPPTDAGSNGPLFQSGFGAPVSGSTSVSAAANDLGSGVQSVAVQIDGQTVAQSPAQCAQPYTRMTPCPSTYTGNIAVDTTKIADGTHAVQLVGTDASGSGALLRSGTVVIGNGSAVGPGADPNLRGPSNGAYGADDAKIRAWWPATGRGASPKKAIVKHCKRSKSYRRAHAVLCNGKEPGTRLTVGYSSKKSNLVRGRLMTPAGQPIAGATVQIVDAPKATGAPATVIARPTTDATGSFSARIAVATGSANIAVNWLARARDTQPASSVSLLRNVRVKTTFHASPKRRVRHGKTIEFSGRLTGKAGSAAGTAVVVQIDAGSGFREAITQRARANGIWIARYRVPKQLRGTYRFRALVQPSGSYPYAIGTSNKKAITVR